MGWHLWLSAVGEPSRPKVAILYRLVTSLGDGIGFVAGFVAEKRLNRRS